MAMEAVFEIIPPDILLIGQQVVETLSQAAVVEPTEADADSAKRLQTLL